MPLQLNPWAIYQSLRSPTDLAEEAYLNSVEERILMNLTGQPVVQPSASALVERSVNNSSGAMPFKKQILRRFARENLKQKERKAIGAPH